MNFTKEFNITQINRDVVYNKQRKFSRASNFCNIFTIKINRKNYRPLNLEMGKIAKNLALYENFLFYQQQVYNHICYSNVPLNCKYKKQEKLWKSNVNRSNWAYFVTNEKLVILFLQCIQALHFKEMLKLREWYEHYSDGTIQDQFIFTSAKQNQQKNSKELSPKGYLIKVKIKYTI